MEVKACLKLIDTVLMLLVPCAALREVLYLIVSSALGILAHALGVLTPRRLSAIERMTLVSKAGLLQRNCTVEHRVSSFSILSRSPYGRCIFYGATMVVDFSPV